MIVVDTNVLVYATFEDSKYHKESVNIIQREDVIIPQIVVYEYLKVLSELVPDLNFVKTKTEELTEFNIVCEDMNIILQAINLIKNTKLSLKNINDFIILSFSLYTKSSLATFDVKLRKLAEKNGVNVLPS
ncbi:MAG: PIN domain-containing protein [Saccharolobus sp.]|uniref:PIN domain-containing protein n=2 Tax=Saccharolobus shibatae TaxID=2286 RepID=A0A8F5BNC6_SACSH|nr:PIN domain-containing protein [Saccharolobus shibatae]MCH4816687.1 PIN domain-containing protein [Saccharolobus shibatae]QXJ28475.1 hypothetical protein J5U23_01344 [Saccharolobus shibatae B12]QXJ31804.1 hypothetical protein J5U21_01455 [Saccharolobus shibatae]